MRLAMSLSIQGGTVYLNSSTMHLLLIRTDFPRHLKLGSFCPLGVMVAMTCASSSDTVPDLFLFRIYTVQYIICSYVRTYVCTPPS